MARPLLAAAPRLIGALGEEFVAAALTVEAFEAVTMGAAGPQNTRKAREPMWGRVFIVCPKGADYQWGKDPLEQLMVRFDSWRAVSSGNRAGRSLATKSTYGGRAIRRAVTRVKLEQASKVKMWMPTRLTNGEGCTGREETRRGSAL